MSYKKASVVCFHWDFLKYGSFKSKFLEIPSLDVSFLFPQKFLLIGACSDTTIESWPISNVFALYLSSMVNSSFFSIPDYQNSLKRPHRVCYDTLKSILNRWHMNSAWLSVCFMVILIVSVCKYFHLRDIQKPNYKAHLMCHLRWWNAKIVSSILHD